MIFLLSSPAMDKLWLMEIQQTGKHHYKVLPQNIFHIIFFFILYILYHSFINPTVTSSTNWRIHQQSTDPQTFYRLKLTGKHHYRVLPQNIFHMILLHIIFFIKLEKWLKRGHKICVHLCIIKISKDIQYFFLQRERTIDCLSKVYSDNINALME